MKRAMMALLLGALISGCNAQEKGGSKNENQGKDTLATKMPKATWKVDKEVDEDGNIVRYDSIYSYSYRNMDSIPFGIDLDSIMKGMPFLSHGDLSSFLQGQNLGHVFDKDSLMQGNHFFEEFFERQRTHNFSDMKQLMRQMDSLQQIIMGGKNGFLPKTIEEKSRL
ncbi:MAG TPA: hypothetical protein VLZ54_00425 [Arenibacter sp.]|nr:hypothetical protein [Arenibacter sp.]